MEAEIREREWPAEEIRRILREELRPHYDALAECRSTAELHEHPRYRKLAPVIQVVLERPETGHYAGGAAPPARDRYRFVAWNIERGIELDRQIETFRTHPYLSRADVLLLTETDVGMARSGNRDVAQTMARELGMHYAFAPCYLSLVKGSGAEREIEGDNEMGLHGNALLSRYPIGEVRSIRLENGIDKMSGREKRIGCQAAVAARVELPGMPLTAVTVHLDANSTQRHRRDQMRMVIDALPAGEPVVLGGDWNTTTFNSSTSFHAIMGYWLRVMMGPDNVIRNHYLHPYRRFERELFEMIEASGFDFRRSNVPGEYTIYYEFENKRTYKGLAEWVPRWCFPFIRWALRNHQGRCPLKIDWFATRGVQPVDPRVIHDVREGLDVPLSDHDAIALDLLPGTGPSPVPAHPSR